jgi:hypothetical protein
MLGVRWVEHSFSVEMRSKRFVKGISISDEAHDRVLFEGNLGELVELSLAEGDVLEFMGVNGVLRIDLTEEQLRKMLTCKRLGSSLSSELGSYTNTNKQENKK